MLWPRRAGAGGSIAVHCSGPSGRSRDGLLCKQPAVHRAKYDDGQNGHAEGRGDSDDRERAAAVRREEDHLEEDEQPEAHEGSVVDEAVRVLRSALDSPPGYAPDECPDVPDEQC